jgi:ring-1,2-phenylacetyl-CoA epoxidase subunit PaaE
MHYICGPTGLKNTIKETLLNLTGNLNNVFAEDFELVKNPEDFKDIFDQEIILNFEGKENKIVIGKGNSVLESALEMGLELPYSCQTGSCSSCKATLLSGELKMIGLDKSRRDLSSKEFLLCCSYPLSENIKLSI